MKRIDARCPNIMCGGTNVIRDIAENEERDHKCGCGQEFKVRWWKTIKVDTKREEDRHWA